MSEDFKVGDRVILKKEDIVGNIKNIYPSTNFGILYEVRIMYGRNVAGTYYKSYSIHVKAYEIKPHPTNIEDLL